MGFILLIEGRGEFKFLYVRYLIRLDIHLTHETIFIYAIEIPVVWVEPLGTFTVLENLSPLESVSPTNPLSVSRCSIRSAPWRRDSLEAKRTSKSENDTLGCEIAGGIRGSAIRQVFHRMILKKRPRIQLETKCAIFVHPSPLLEKLKQPFIVNCRVVWQENVYRGRYNYKRP